MRALLANNAEVDRRNEAGKTPLDLFEEAYGIAEATEQPIRRLLQARE